MFYQPVNSGSLQNIQEAHELDMDVISFRYGMQLCIKAHCML
jgi:hypothetical protein